MLARSALPAAAIVAMWAALLAVTSLLPWSASVKGPAAGPIVAAPAPTGSPTAVPPVTAPRSGTRTEAAAVAAGRELFAERCTACHGVTPQELGRLADAAWLPQRGDAALGRVITGGKSLPGAKDAMPPFGVESGGPFGPEDVGALVMYLRTLAGLPPAAPTPAPRPSLDPAAVARGAELFARSCAECHGERADEIAAAPLRDVGWLDWRGDAALSRSVAQGKGDMRAFAAERGGTLTAEDIAAILLYLRSLSGPP